jgi:Serine carboxypeptidase
MYAGLMPIDMNNTSRALYFVFQPTVGAPVDEITIWLNGGPGKLRYVTHSTFSENDMQDVAHLRASFKKMGDLFGALVNTLQRSILTLG